MSVRIEPNFSDQFCEWLVSAGYTHCFFLAGGNIMHLLNSARSRFVCIPVIHEVTATIAVEYFNESSEGAKAFALVTAGPGLTNCTTGIAGAWLESREILVVGGQVKSTDLASGGLRLRGIQEIDGVSIFKSITKAAELLDKPMSRIELGEILKMGSDGRPGPVYMEICLDVQGGPGKHLNNGATKVEAKVSPSIVSNLNILVQSLKKSSRPILLLGGGVSRNAANKVHELLEEKRIPVMTTWNAADRISASHPMYWGRPQTQGQRAANLLLQQADLVIALGTRLGLQQTGFNWEEFCPLAEVIQIFNDPSELTKGHPKVDLGILGSPDEYLLNLCMAMDEAENESKDEWLSFGQYVLTEIPAHEVANKSSGKFIDIYAFIRELSSLLNSKDIIISSSSGGTFTLVMQAFEQKKGQKIISSGALASMGYALPGAIGAAYANPHNRVILIDGDGGFAQILQELGTVSRGNLPIKIFIVDNVGYGSIRKTQTNYFGSERIGCDPESGLGLPNWVKVFDSFGISAVEISSIDQINADVLDMINDDLPRAFILMTDPDQTYYPRLTNRLLEDGKIISTALHEMSPPLGEQLSRNVMKYLENGGVHE